MKQIILLLLIVVLFGAGQTACSSVSRVTVSVQDIPIVDTISHHDAMLEFIQPYKDSLELEMNQVIGYSPIAMIKERPCSPLMNWTADAILSFGKDSLVKTNALVISLLNYGGIRSTIDKGEITTASIFKLMPFDNQLVAVELPISILDSINEYMTVSGGEAIGGGKFIHGKFIPQRNIDTEATFWVVTNDYLYHGGDKMNFFQYELTAITSNVLLRDVFMDAVKKQDTLVVENEIRFLK